MSPVIEAVTDRLVLRRLGESDFDPFSAMNADPNVMRYFPRTLAPAETREMMNRNDAHFERHGFGFWAVEMQATGEFAGFIGLGVPGFAAHFTPCVEIGWRLASSFWNRGIATEGARAILDRAFHTYQLREIIAFTTVTNLPSRRVMEKIGMTYNPRDNFLHPNIEEGDPLRPHVLYRRSPLP